MPRKPARAAVPDVRNLAELTADARDACSREEPVPAPPRVFADLRDRVAAARPRLPPLYQVAVVDPLSRTLAALGPGGFRDSFRPRARIPGPLLLELAAAILQRAERLERAATRAFQEVVSDLYDGFLSAEDRRGVKAPDLGVIPPLVKWGSDPLEGPYTIPVDDTALAGAGAGLVSLPRSCAHRGLLAWAALGHETAGHDILGADIGLREELAGAIRAALRGARPAFLAGYWADRIDETASDVMGILNMGPAAGIGLVGFFRGFRAAAGFPERLDPEGNASDPHPADVLRGWLAGATVRLLSFSGAAAWADRIDAEATADGSAGVRLEGRSVGAGPARASAAAVALALVRTPMRSLEGHALGDIQDWRDTDEATVARLRPVLSRSAAVPASPGPGAYAAHAVAAAVSAGLAGEAGARAIQRRLLALLGAMEDSNPAWGPGFAIHRGDQEGGGRRRVG